MEFRILGPLEVWDGGGGIAIPRRQQRVLLATLVIRAGEVVSVDRLVDDLWGDDPPAAAVGSLQNTVSQLRKLLGADTLRRQPPGYVLEVDREAIDARRFERLVASGAGLEPAERATVLREALALWRGPALADLADEPCVAVEATRLDELRLVALEGRIGAELELGRHYALVAQLEALTAEHRLREPLHGQLALALYRSGRQADALEVIATVRTALDDLGLQLSPELKQLERDILNHSPSIAAPDVVVEAEDAEEAGERRLVSVLAADLPSEDDPEALRELLRRVLEAANDAVARHGGELERFGPEGLVAVFGTDGSREDDALRAVRAAVELHEAAEVAVGVATGEAVVGGEPRVASSAVAHAAGLARTGRGVLVEPRTLALVRDAVTVEEAGGIARVVAVQPARPVPRDDTPLVGRTDELDRVRAALDNGPGATFTVVGEAGIGKSRLARELVRSFDGAVLVGRCAAYGEGATFLPLADALRGVDASAALDGSDDAELVSTRIAALEGVGQTPGTLGESYWAVRRLLESLAAVRPLLLVLDDVHWAEPALLDLVDYLDARAGEAPLRILCLARPELLETRPAWAARFLLALEPLAQEETRELVDAVADLDDEASARIVELAEGNPLYAQQLAAFAAESGKALEPGAMPATIDAVLAGRLGRLDADERATLQRAAVVGRIFSRGAVAALAPPDLAVDAHLLALARRGFVQALPDPLPGDDAYRFHHGLLRDTAYASLTKELRADLHVRVAAWLDRDGSGDDALVGYHLERAAALRPDPDVTEAAGERLGRAGYHAAARGDTPAAGILLERAVALLPSAPRRAELLWELAIQQHLVGRSDASSALDEAEVEAARHDDRQVAARVAVERAARGLNTGALSPEEALAPATEAIPILEEADDRRGLGRTWLTIAAAHNYRCEMARMGEAHARAESYTTQIGFSTAASIGGQAASLLYGPTPATTAISVCLDLLERADLAGRANVLACLGALHGLVGRFSEADDLLAASRTAYLEVGLTVALNRAWSHAAFSVARLAGRSDEADARALASMDALVELGESAWVATRAAQRAELALDRGEDSSAAKLATLAKRHASKHDVLVQFMVMRLQARLKARGGDPVAAERLAQRAVAVSEGTDDLSARADTLMALAEVLVLGGASEAASQAAADADALYEAKENVAGRDLSRTLLEAVRAKAA